MTTRMIEVEIGDRRGALPESDNLSPSSTVVSALASVPEELVAKAISDTIELVGRAITPRADGPESCEVKFGVKISASGGVILAKMASEVNLEIKVVWKRNAPTTKVLDETEKGVGDQPAFNP